MIIPAGNPYKDIGDRIKQYETQCTSERFDNNLPVIIRIDGRCFSNFTKTFERPFDEELHNVMVKTTTRLLQETDAVVGFTQSDEINLILYKGHPRSELFFGGRMFKLVSNLASIATSEFTLEAMKIWKDLTTTFKPTFDCRAFQVPSKTEAVNVLYWRELDVVKNSVSQLARHYFSHTELQNKTFSAMRRMVYEKQGIKFADLPYWQTRGTFLRRNKVKTKMTQTDLDQIPPKYWPDDRMIERNQIVNEEIPRIMEIANKEQVFFDGAKPILI